MCTFKHFVVLFIVQNTVSSYLTGYYEFYQPENSESMSNKEETYSDTDIEYNIDNSQPNRNKLCLEKDQSSISYSDMKYLIEDKVDELQIKENLVNSYYPEAEELYETYLEELEDIRETLEDRPEHMLHILNDMASSRKKLEPIVEEIVFRLQEFESLIIYNYNDIKERSEITLNQLDKYKKICQFNCENYKIASRFGHIITRNPFIVSQLLSVNNNVTYCVRLRDLNGYIDTKLSQFEAQYVEVLYRELKIRDEIYAQKILEFKNNLIEAAVKKFGMTMYGTLSLQDDYHHFLKYLKNINVSSELDSIEENVAEIKLKIIGLKRDIEKYRQYCMTCNNINIINPREKRNVHADLRGLQDDIPKEKQIGEESYVVNELINAKIDEIKEIIKTEFVNMFEELDKDFNDLDMIDLYVTKLKPIQNEIENDIITEQKALNILRNRIPKASINHILELSKESKQVIKSLESAKQFIEKFVSI